MFRVLASSAVDRGLEARSGQTKDYNIGICCISAQHAALRRKSKDWLARNQNNFVLPSTGFELTPLIHCSTIRLALRPAP